MTPAPEQPQDQREQAAQPREESALPVANAAPSSPLQVADQRRTALKVFAGTMTLVILASGVLEYQGWQIAFQDMPAPHPAIPPLSFLRGVFDNTLGAIGIGAAGVVGTLLFPSTWRSPWRRVPAAFAVGAGAFLAFLSFVTFGILR